jgi:3-oxoacyl-[acyl-carrier-protein] synthase-1
MICDQNGEAYRADELAFMLVRLSERFTDGSDFEAPADCWGDVGAASGPLFVVLAAAAAERGYARGPHYVLWTSSESGERGAALLQLHVKPRK